MTRRAETPSEEQILAWVRETYAPMFTAANPLLEKGCTETAKRIVNFLNEHKQYDLAQIEAATRLYIANTDRKYLRRPYYFVRKKIDGVWVSDLLSWLEKYRELVEDRCNESVTNVLQ